MRIDPEMEKVERRHCHHENDVEDEMYEKFARGRSVEKFGFASPNVPIVDDGVI